MGRGCLFQDSVYVRAGASGRVAIGDRAAINSFCQLYGHGGITIGEDTQLGPGTIVTTTGHDYEGDLEESYRPIRIGRRVWIGANVTIIGGVSIGDGAVIGAGAVVIRDVPPGAVAVGVPARVVKTHHPKGVSDERQGALQIRPVG
ncbi:MAG: acyltransferase [Gammaproteobacteria bacterium]|nr:acyltransferase [Gammaproteobacteria bacterium]